MAFSTQFFTIQTAFQNSFEQSSDVNDYPSDDEFDLDPHGIFSSYGHEVYPSFSSFDGACMPPHHDGSASDEDARSEFEHRSSDDVAPSSSSRSVSGSSNPRNKPSRRSFPSRNLQGTSTKPLKKVQKPNPWACPFQDCFYIQRNRRRLADLRRHMNTHRDQPGKKQSQWVCCGVPVELISKYKSLTGSERRHVFRGRDMIAGCLRELSRKDALQRHLKDVGCVGDAKWCES